MDHHCYFVNNCIGFHNYKNFFNFLCWLLVFCIIVIGIVIADGINNDDDDEYIRILLLILTSELPILFPSVLAHLHPCLSSHASPPLHIFLVFLLSFFLFLISNRIYCNSGGNT